MSYHHNGKASIQPRRGRISVQDLICNDDSMPKTKEKNYSTVSNSCDKNTFSTSDPYNQWHEKPQRTTNDIVMEPHAKSKAILTQKQMHAYSRITRDFEDRSRSPSIEYSSRNRYKNEIETPEVKDRTKYTESLHNQVTHDTYQTHSITENEMIFYPSYNWEKDTPETKSYSYEHSSIEKNNNTYRQPNIVIGSNIQKKERASVKLKKLWTPHEDELLRQLANMGPENWNKISASLPGRTGKQCRERWLNHLRDGIRKGFWTPAEDQIIIQEQAKLGNRWSVIARMLPGRSDNAVKNRFNATLKKQNGRRQYQ